MVVPNIEDGFEKYELELHHFNEYGMPIYTVCNEPPKQKIDVNMMFKTKVLRKLK